MQHNNWAKDRDLLAEAVGRVFSEQHDPELEDLARDAMGYDQQEDPTRDVENEEGEGNVLERLEEFMNSHPETVEGLRQIIIDFEDIIDDINSLEAPDQMIDAFDLGIHLARLAPDTTKGSALY